MEYLGKLGYDEALYSTKSKPFSISFHCNSKLSVKIGNALGTQINERAWDLMMKDHYEKKGATEAIQNPSAIAFRAYHKKGCCGVYGAINKTNEEITMNFSMNESKGMIYQPLDGTVSTTIPPKSIIYLGTSILDPGYRKFTISRRFTTS